LQTRWDINIGNLFQNKYDSDYDKSEFKNQNAYDNEDFNRDCNEIIVILIFIESAEFTSFESSTEIDDYQFERCQSIARY
jgi:hypothetical protein